jgi:nucleoside 2-deoxyribosyltransferase
MGKKRVYCAGPLFNDKEREEMAGIAAALEEKGFETFLPQRDGLELTRCVEGLTAGGLPVDEANALIAQAIFALDIYQVLEGCVLLVANLNGRVPDEGMVAEAAMAWARGKPVFAFKSDTRTAFGGNDNPLVTGLFGFKVAKSIPGVVALVEAHVRDYPIPDPAFLREEEIGGKLELGRAIWDALSRSETIKDVIDAIRDFNASVIARG